MENVIDLSEYPSELVVKEHLKALKINGNPVFFDDKNLNTYLDKKYFEKTKNKTKTKVKFQNFLKTIKTYKYIYNKHTVGFIVK